MVLEELSGLFQHTVAWGLFDQDQSLARRDRLLTLIAHSLLFRTSIGALL